MVLRERIVQESSKLFFKNGIRSVTMSDIAVYLGISKRTLYEVFKDKEELLEVCINAHMEKVDLEIRELLVNSENVIESMMRIYRSHLTEVHNTNKSMIYDLKKYHPRLYDKIENMQRSGVSLMVPLHEKGIEQGLIRPEINFEICTWLMKSQFKMLMEGEFIPIERYDMNEFVRTIILNFVRGIATPKGNELIDSIVSEYNLSDVN
jgi:Transcriptional regulator